MIKNYFKIAWRNLWKNKGFSFINIAGLATGMCGAILIFTWVQNELSFDRFHKNADNLYKVWNKSDKDPAGNIYTWDITSAPIAPELKQKFPEIKAAARVYWPNDRLFNYKEKSIVATGLDVDPQFLSMFSFPMVNGSEHALDDPKGIVLSASLAKSIFGSEDPTDKVLRINDKENYKVTGVVNDPPSNTQFKFDYLVSIQPLIGTSEANNWGNASFNTYVQLEPGTNVAALDNKIKNILRDHDPGLHFGIFLHPSSKWHLNSRFENGVAVGGAIETVRILLGIAGLILLVACINFMNLSTAQSEKRGKEVGVRKVIGANRFAIIKQFLTESILITIISGVLAVVLVQLTLPAFNQLTGINLSINYSSPYLWLSGIGFILFTGLLAGSYPAFYLSSFRPVKVLKGLFKAKAQVISPRKVLVVTQFTVAIVLIISTIIIYQQIEHVQSRDNGYVRNNLVEHPVNDAINKSFDALKNDLLSSGAAVAVSKTSMSVTIDGSQGSGFNWGDMDASHKEASFSRFGTTGDFVKTFGFKLIAGRDIDFNKYPSDSSAVIINEAAVKLMGLKDPVGQTVINNGGSRMTVVGVIKNFIIGSPSQDINPMMVFGSKRWSNALTFRLNPNKRPSESLKAAEAIFKKYNPAYPFQYSFVDQAYAAKFKNEQRVGKIAFTFSALTIIISCLGLFGLAAYVAESRSKEIGIRKVLGAGIVNLMQLLTRDFVVLVLISVLIAAPIGWWFMSKWLQDFNYRIQISWTIFLYSGLVAVLIAVITVSFQAAKAALANPIKSIKTE
ncbi:ABC transporter permease [Mucilaginibacter conchicola]|uniref:ABC transporter permease n=1 Tax=Mucilaginibacter conchicola TaxID=2303333 RepID=A0A372NZ11_9SPHI|nr:ABC transporter permease [Mucilaginibacter conchicola]RFZ95343.1 ABC transporter permease [Mucilaginibacter conchicola]